MNGSLFLDFYERNVDPTDKPPGDCSLYANAPLRNKIPDWWIMEEEDPNLVLSWIKGVRNGALQIEFSCIGPAEDIGEFLSENEQRVLCL